MSQELVFDHYPLPATARPRGWTLVNVGQVARLVASGFPTGEHNQERRGIVHIRPMNIDREGRLDLSVVKHVEGAAPRRLAYGDVLFNNTNSPELIGKSAPVLIETELAYSNHMTRICLEDGLNPTFIARQLHYLWMTGYFRHRCVNHVNQASISAGPLAETVPLLLPPTAEQERIADVLDELLSDLDAGVAALHRVRTKLALYRATVLKAAFEGSLTAAWRAQHPDVAPASALLEHILVGRRRRWEDDQLAKFEAKSQEPPKNWRAKYGEPPTASGGRSFTLPDGWIWSSLGQCFEVHVGATPSRAVKENWNGEIPWVASGEVRFRDITGTREKITVLGLANSSTTVNPAGSVILNMIGEGATRGKAAILRIDASNNQNCAAIWVSRTPVEPGFVFLWLICRYQQTRELASGNNQPALNKRIVEGIPVPLPSGEEQAAIVEIVEGQLSVVDHIEADLDAKLKAAQSLRQAILRHAFSGKLVPQDPTDEPASELLKRIAAERSARPSKGTKARQRPSARRRSAKDERP